METKNIQPLEGFDWEAFENDGVSAADKAAQQAAYEGTLNNVNDNEVVDGTVTAINDREVVVNIGYKSDGIIPASEFRYNPDLKGPVGALSQEGSSGSLLGARERSAGEQRDCTGLREVPHKGWYDC